MLQLPRSADGHDVLDKAALLSAVETIIRVVLSNIVQSMESVARIAEDLTGMVTGFLRVEELSRS